MSSEFSLADLTSRKGWVRVHCDLRIWIPCPAQFPDHLGLDLNSWSTAMAEAWWEQSGLEYGHAVVDKLACMLREVREQGYENVPCHQIWAYYRDFTVPPLPIHIGIWMMTGNRDQQLRALSGATDPSVIRKPLMAEFTTKTLGTGVRTVRYKEVDHGNVVVMLGFAFRSEKFETDLQVTTGTPDLHQLEKATTDIEDFVHGISIYYNPAPQS
ncbi:MAG TPA: hypothetical protein VF070_20245 [Streptosporangiaceae bacterium]